MTHEDFSADAIIEAAMGLRELPEIPAPVIKRREVEDMKELEVWRKLQAVSN